MRSPWQNSDVPRGADYDERWTRLAEAGHDVHGEASFLVGYGPRRVLDAGCGTGRVAIELHRRGLSVVGVDIDREMLQTASDKEPDIEWFRADLSTLHLTDDAGAIRRFHCVVCAGNVMVFLDPGTETATVGRLADHLVPGGLLVSGFQLVGDGYSVERYDDDCQAAGLEPYERFSSWNRDPWDGTGGYAVSVHRRPPPPRQPASS